MNLASAGYQDGIVRQANVSDVEVDELSAVVVTCPEGDREPDLPNRDCGAVGDSGEGLGWLKLVVGHLEIVEHFHGQDVEPCPSLYKLEGRVTCGVLLGLGLIYLLIPTGYKSRF